MPIVEELAQGHNQPEGLLAEGINRAYVHESVLGQWVVASSADATEALWFMGVHKYIRIVGNILGPGGDVEKAWVDDAAALEDMTSTLLSSDERRYIDPFFRHAGVSLISMDLESDLSEPPVVERFVPTGGPLYSSCFDQNYHTYAFDGPGNQKMRDEEGPMKKQAETVASGEGVRDLALLNGSNGDFIRSGRGVYDFNMDAIIKGVKIAGDYLVPVERAIGPDGTMTYVRQARPSECLQLKEVFDIEKIARFGIVQIADVRIDMVRRKIDAQKNKIGKIRYGGRIGQIEHLQSEVARVIGRHHIIREEFYPQAS